MRKDATRSLYPHQREALSKLSNGKILLGGVGSGKSRVAMAYYVDNEWPKPIFVITTARKRDDLDWLEEAAHFGISEVDEGLDGSVLTVDSWNNIAKYTDQSDAFFIFDEQRAIGSGAWSKAFLRIARKNRWVILSGTPGDVWTDYIPVFIANGFYKNRTEFKNRHLLYSYWGGYPKLERVLDVPTLNSHRASILVEMAFERHTTRLVEFVRVGYDKEAYKKVLKTRQDPETGEPYPNAAAFVGGLRQIVNQSDERVSKTREIARRHPRLIIFYNFNYELEALRGLAEELKAEGYVTKEWNGFKHEPVPTTDKWLYLVQYSAGAEAWNCVTTDAMLFYSQTYSWKQFEQAQGRIDRMNTPFKELHYYVLRSESPVDISVSEALEKKEDFNAKAWLKTIK